MLTHIVLFRFEDLARAEEARQKLLSMSGQIPGMLSVEAGLDVTRSPRSHELGLITRHTDREALAAYQVHPVHEAVAAFIRTHMSGAASVDFES